MVGYVDALETAGSGGSGGRAGCVETATSLCPGVGASAGLARRRSLTTRLMEEPFL